MSSTTARQPGFLATLALAACALATATSGCVTLRPAVTPMRTLDLTSGRGSCLVVLLPGRWDKPESFVKAGFARAVEQRGLAIDLLAVDAHLGYYRDRQVTKRLHEDVIGPARAAGYTTIWLVGPSLGGLGSLLYARDYPSEVAGVLALAPYLGEDDVIAELVRAGGPLAWRPPALIDANTDVGRELWSWLAPWASRRPPPPLYLGWGVDDSLASAGGLLASLLPPERVFTTPGSHQWPAWERLWETFLDADPPCPGRM
jgi:pimeloyl-ACP methyl ester carboxylesterase